MIIERGNFVVVDLPEYLVAKLSTERFELIKRVVIEQSLIDVQKIVGQVMRSVVRRRQVITATNGVGNWHYTFSVVEFLQVVARRVGDNINDIVNHGVELGTVDVFVKSMSRVIATGKIDGSNAKFRRDNGNVGERTLRGLETFAGDVSLKVGIVTAVINGVIFALTVKLDEKFESVDFFRQLVLLMSKAKFFSTKSTNFLVATEQEPRFDFGNPIDFDESKDAATIVAANALRAHDDIFVSRDADVLDGLFVNGVEMSDEHDGSLPTNENEIALAD